MSKISWCFCWAEIFSPNMGITKEFGGRLHLQSADLFSNWKKNRVAKRALISYGFVHSTVGCQEQERGFVHKMHMIILYFQCRWNSHSVVYSMRTSAIKCWTICPILFLLRPLRPLCLSWKIGKAEYCGIRRLFAPAYFLYPPDICDYCESGGYLLAHIF